MEVEESMTQTDNFVLGNTIDCNNISSMRTNNTELFDMLVFGAAFTLQTLFEFPLQVFGHAGWWVYEYDKSQDGWVEA